MSLPLLFASSLIEIRPGMIIWTIITFVLLALILRWKAWGPIVSLVDEREKQIHNAIEAAKKERAEAEKLLNEQKEALAEARRDAQEKMKRAQDEVERYRQELQATARKEAEAMKNDALRQIADERAKAIAEIKSLTADLAIDIAGKLIGERLDDAKHKSLAEQYVDQVAGQKAPMLRKAAV